MLEFQQFHLEHKELIDSYFQSSDFMCSEFTFTNVIIWGQDGKIQWAERNGVLYVRLRFGNQPPFMFPPIPKNKNANYTQAIDVALQYFYDTGNVPLFRSVNGPFISLFQQHCPMFTLSPNRNTFDYVYLAEDLISLSGRKYHAKRNHIHQFTSQYDYVYKPLTPDMEQACMELYLSWLEEKDIHEPGILGEMKAIHFLLPNMETLGVQGGSIYVQDKLVAFSLGEKIRQDLAVIHIEKADAAYPGLYALINQQFAEHAWQDVRYINREEDMGIPGMRKAKLSYQPEMLVEKYDAVWRP